MRRLTHLTTTLIFSLSASSLWAASSESEKTLVIYNQNLALVRDSRLLHPIPAGETQLIKGVSPLLQPETLQIHGAGRILEHNLDQQLISQQQLLETSIGHPIDAIADNGEVLSGELLAIESNRILLQRAGSIETVPLNDRWRFRFSQLPEQIISQPSLSFRSTGTKKTQAVTLSYLTQGFSWQSDYVLQVDKNNALLEGFATLNNQSGMDMKQTEVKLFAGQLNQPTSRPMALKRTNEVMMAMAMDASSPEEQSLEGFHLFSLPEKLDLLNGQQKQLPLVTQQVVKVARRYDYDFQVQASPDFERMQQKTTLHMLFNNSTDQPMPAGNIRVFSTSKSGEQLFSGGSYIPHTPVGASIDTALGQAFDVLVDQKQLSIMRSPDGSLVNYELRIRNHGEEQVTVRVRGRFSQPWEILRSAPAVTDKQSGLSEWSINVSGRSDQLISFQARLERR